MPLSVELKSIFTRSFWLNFWNLLSQNALNALLQILGLLFIYIVLRRVLYRVLDGLLDRLLQHESRLGLPEERIGRLQTLQGLCKSILGYVLFFVFGVLFLKAVGFDILPVITTASVLGVAVALGSQKLFKDVISGFFLIVDNLFVVGDTVTITTITGTVQEIGMRVTRLVDANGRVHQFANGDIGTVTNLSRNPVDDFIEVNIGTTADLNHAVTILNAAGETLFAAPNHALKAAPRVLGITAFTAAATTIRLSVISDPRNLTLEQMRVRETMRTALLAAEIPLA